MVEGKPRVTVSGVEVRAAGVSGEEKDQSIWGGESLSRDEAAGEVRGGGGPRAIGGSWLHSECDGSHRGDCTRGVM